MPKLVVDFQSDTGSTSKRQLADLPDRVVEGNPHHQNKSHFVSLDESMLKGTWTSMPRKWHAVKGENEFFSIVSGHVELILHDGAVQIFRTRDACLPKRF